jgi:hypothetical protein
MHRRCAASQTACLPDRVQQCVPGESLSLMTRHVVDETEIQGSGADFLAAHGDSHGRRVDEDIVRLCWSFGGRELLPVRDHHITSLRAGLLTHRIQPHSNLEVGDRVRITTGPMTHMEGVLERHKNELPVVLKLEMIGRSVSVEVGAEEVEFVGPTLERTRPMVLNSFPRLMAGISAC